MAVSDVTLDFAVHQAVQQCQEDLMTLVTSQQARRCFSGQEVSFSAGWLSIDVDDCGIPLLTPSKDRKAYDRSHVFIQPWLESSDNSLDAHTYSLA